MLSPSISRESSSFVEVSEPDPDAEDLESTPHSLSRAVYERRAEYTRPHSMKIKVGTWNVAACPGVHNDIRSWFVDGKGVDTKLAGLKVADPDGRNVEVRSKGDTGDPKSIPDTPLGDEGIVLGGEHVGLYVLGLQEIVTLASAKEYIGRVYVDPEPLNKWKRALEEAVPDGYELIADTQMSGLLLLIYASPTIAPTVSSVSSVSVGTGIMGYLGNKGAVCTRIVLGETTRLAFINSHLASGTDKAHYERRCWDYNQITTRTKFDPVSVAGETSDIQEVIGDEDFAFWFGDLNFRLDGLPGDDIRRLLMLHARGEYAPGSSPRNYLENEIAKSEEPILIRHVESDDDEPIDLQADNPRTSSEASSIDLPDPDDFLQDPHSDPTSLQATLDSLLPHDQLRRVQRQKKAFHEGWREGPITFIPTYKYDVGTFGVFDSGEKMRPPSWCDRILFRTRRDKLEYDGKTRDEEAARVKDEEMKSRGIAEAAQDEEVIFDYDPASDGVDTYGDYDEYDEGEDNREDVTVKDELADKLNLEIYTSHQRVTSSDHKPLDAVFTISYDAIVPELKSRVHQEVARELDRAENEHRPGVTILVEHPDLIDDVPGSPTTTDAADGVNFGDVKYLYRKERSLTIANTGQVPATFAFISKPSGPGQPDQVAPSWLRPAFDSYDDDGAVKRLEAEVTLEPGDTIMVTLEIYVEDFAQVRALNMGELHLDEVLILRVTDGRDYFIPVRGTWLQSCFGRTIDELIHIPEGGGARALRPSGHKDGVQQGSLSAIDSTNLTEAVPRELTKLTDTFEPLLERAIAEREMTGASETPVPDAWPFEPTTASESRSQTRTLLLEALDTNTPLNASFPPGIREVEKLETTAEVLQLFVASLTDGIIPAPFWKTIDDDLAARKRAPTPDETRILTMVPLADSPPHSIALVHLVVRLGKVVTMRAPPSSNPATEAKPSRFDFRQSMGYGRARRATLTDDPGLAARRAIERRIAEVWAPVMIRGPEGVGEKERWASEARKRGVVEAFLAKE